MGRPTTSRSDRRRLVDDRGRSWPVPGRRAVQGDRRWSDPAFRSAAEGYLMNLRLGSGSVNGLTAMVIIAALAMAGYFMAIAAGVGAMGSTVVLVLMLVGCGVWARGRMAADRPSWTAHLPLARGLCPSCLYAVGGMPNEADGCVVCPECGAAWAGERVGLAAGFKEASEQEVARAWSRWHGSSVARKPLRDLDGHHVYSVDTKLANEIASSADERMRARLERAAVAMRRRGRVWRLLGLSAVAFYAWMLLSQPGALQMPGLNAGTLIVFGMVFWVPWSVWSLLRGSRGIPASRIVRCMLAEWLCPSCAADLRGGRRQGGALVECRDCRCTWRPGDES